MLFIVFIIGLIIGSFLNAFIWRLRTGDSLWRGRSYCPKCKKPLRWYELIPLLSFFLQWGICRGCKQKIGWQYPLVELATGVLFILAYTRIWNLEFGIWNFFGNWKLVIENLLMWYFFAVLIILFVYDLRYNLIPDRVVLPGIIIAFTVNILLTDNKLLATYHSLLSIIVGAGFFAAQHYLSRGRWIGAGDIYFGALMGAMLANWRQIIVALIVSYLIGGFIGAVLLLSGKKKFGETVPMGTFLAIGTLITLLWGDWLLKMYLPL